MKSLNARLRSLGKWASLPVVLLLFVAGYGWYSLDERAADFDLDNWDGKTVNLERLKGKVVLLTFSYSFCSVRCPIVTARLLALDGAVKAPRDVVYLHVSVDPEMDTPERRKKYFKLYGIDAEKDGRWMFVSGERWALSEVWNAYGIGIKRIESKDLPEGYYMEYTPKIVLIGKKGRIRQEADYFFSEDDMAKKIKEAI